MYLEMCEIITGITPSVTPGANYCLSCLLISLRWPSFRTADHLNQPASSLQISSQSAGQLSLLQKFSLLRLTAIMEKYSMSNKHGWTW